MALDDPLVQGGVNNLSVKIEQLKNQLPRIGASSIKEDLIYNILLTRL